MSEQSLNQEQNSHNNFDISQTQRIKKKKFSSVIKTKLLLGKNNSNPIIDYYQEGSRSALNSPIVFSNPNLVRVKNTTRVSGCRKILTEKTRTFFLLFLSSFPHPEQHVKHVQPK